MNTSSLYRCMYSRSDGQLCGDVRVAKHKKPVRLWRQENQMQCLMHFKPADIRAYRNNRTNFLGKWWVPAIPIDPQDETQMQMFWEDSSVPSEDYEWWYSLPEK